MGKRVHPSRQSITRISWKFGPAFLPDTVMSAYEEPMIANCQRRVVSLVALVWSISLPASAKTWKFPPKAPVNNDSALPTCYDNRHQMLDINNLDVIEWKHNTPNQYHSRAHIHGSVAEIYGIMSGHMHFAVQLSDTTDEVIEVVYNQAFGELPHVVQGSVVEACGDYITSIAPSGPYPVSPAGAIVHWVHQSHNPNHESGFLTIDGVQYGN